MRLWVSIIVGIGTACGDGIGVRKDHQTGNPSPHTDSAEPESSASDTATATHADTAAEADPPEEDSAEPDDSVVPDTGTSPTTEDEDTGSSSMDTGFTPIDTGFDPPDATSCVADFTLHFPDAPSVTLDFCVDTMFGVRFEFDPLGPPHMRDLILQAHAVEVGPTESCWIQLSLPAMCGEGFYRMHGDSGHNVSVDLQDCPGVPEEFRGLFVSREGYTRIDTALVDASISTVPGDTIEATVSGHISVSTPIPPAELGPGLDGDFSVIQALVAETAELTDCIVAGGDEDEDGFITAEFDGGDCDDFDADTYPGSAENDSTTLCMRDADGDGYGITTPRFASIDAGTDCNDDLASVHPGAVDAMGDGVDTDCDGID
jgi:hypothetical protein